MTPVDPYIFQQASCRASLLVAFAGFRPDDWEDLKQEMVLDVFRRSPKFDPARETWMRAPETRAVLDALTQAGAEARFVGGAVRNALLGRPVTDIDIATPLLPEEVTRRLRAAGLGAVPTGIEHGTVTAIVKARGYEITTLRRDVATVVVEGRRGEEGGDAGRGAVTAGR